MITELNDKNFDETVSKGLKLVEFYASWCGFCVKQNIILEDMKEITVYKINGDNFPVITNRYGIKSYPSFVIFKDGKPVNIFSGLHTKFELMNILMQFMKK